MAANLFQCGSFSIKIGQKTILDDLSFDITQGSRVGLIGASGSGKSTLLSAMAGLINYSGLLEYKGTEVSSSHKKLIRGITGIEYVHQTGDLFPDLPVYDNIIHKIKTRPQHTIDSLYDEVADIFRLHPFRDVNVKNLSGGELQRVALAKALLGDFDVLLLDEPFSYQDHIYRTRMMDYILKRVLANDATMVMAAHHPEVIKAMTDELIVLRDGKMHEKGRLEELYNNTSSAYTFNLLGESVPVEQGFIPADCLRREPAEKHIEVLVRRSAMRLYLLEYKGYAFTWRSVPGYKGDTLMLYYDPRDVRSDHNGK